VCRDRPKSLLLSLLFFAVRNLQIAGPEPSTESHQWGLFVVAWHSENLIKTPLIGVVGALFGGLRPPKLPVVTRLCGSEITIGISVPSRDMSSLYLTTLRFCLDSSFCIHEDKKSNSTEQACWVLILSSTSLHAQKTWQWLSHVLQTVLLLVKWTSPLRFQRISQPVAKLEVWASGQKFSWMGSTGHRRGRKEVEKW